MKLKSFQHIDGYDFVFAFENGQIVETNIRDLVSKYVTPEETVTAQLNKEWGCIEFKNGTVDIDPSTLYAFCAAKQPV